MNFLAENLERIGGKMKTDNANKNLSERYSGSKKLRGIWFHGTSTKYFKSIMANGLQPETKEKSWDVDPDASEITVDRSSYGGIYVTKNLLTAYSSAYRTKTKKGGNRMIVIMDLQPRSLIVDEDAIVNYLVGSRVSMINALYDYKIIKYGTEYPEYKQYVDDAREKFANDILKNFLPIHNITNPKLIDILKKYLTSEAFDATVTRTVAYHDMSNYSNQDMWYRNWDLRKIKREDIPPLPTKQQGEMVFRKCVDKLTRLLKSIVAKQDDINAYRKTARSMTPIKFSGSNKIVAIVELIEEKSTPTQVKLLYGTIPEDFVQQFREAINSEFTLDDVIDARY
jgi:hypothetical protein